ncbi:MAG: ABC transporter ATP-binding protein [Promethearchaeota archaeon]
MSPKTIVKFTNINKRFHDLIAVNNLNLEIYEGEILGFVGPNGAGKTTTMKMLGGLIKPTSGKIEIYNHNGYLIDTIKKPADLFKLIGFLIDLPAFYGNITPHQILRYYCRLLGLSKDIIEEQIDWALEIVEMSKWKNKIIKEFSKGMVQRLGLAQALVHDPDVLVLDEPQTGLDPSGRILVRKILQKLKKIGKTIFLSSHLLYEISEVCDRIVIINHGNVIAVDTLINLEQKMTKKQIQCEIFEPLELSQVEKIVNAISNNIEQYCEKGAKNFVLYDDNVPGFNIYYDGTLLSLKKIHEILSIDMRLPIIGFSKIRTSRLEDLYIRLVEQDDDKNGGVLKE